MKNFKVGKKLVISFGTILALFVISVVVVAVSLNSVKTQLTHFYDVPWQTRAAAQELQANLAEEQKSLYKAIATLDESIITPALSDVESYGNKVQANIAIIESKALAANMDVVNDLKNKIAAWDAVEAIVLNMAKDSSISSDEISKYMQENATSIIQEVNDSLASTVATTNKTGETLLAQTGDAQTKTTMLLIIMCSVSVLIGIFLCMYITKSITAPIKELEAVANEMANGELKVTINYDSKDELGNLSNSMRTMADRISYYMTELADAMTQLAGGDLNVPRRDPFLGDFGAVQSAIRTLIASLNDTLTKINQSADQVASGSDQVSSGAQALSQGATEQASSVEELAATITEISQQIRENASNADDASARANAVGEEMAASNNQMQDMITAMQEISNSSNKIGKIIKTIEDIAFQTNILALNAAVEAARAGQAGKGFAVVADEVRNLASKSAEASKDTSALIENSLKAVENGTKIVDNTAQSLVSAVEGAREVALTIDKISGASREQADSILQVTQGVDQISSVVQTNSATAEESAAASEELSGQASMLKDLVSRFKLRNDGSAVNDIPQYSQSDALPMMESYSDKY